MKNKSGKDSCCRFREKIENRLTPTHSIPQKWRCRLR